MRYLLIKSKLFAASPSKKDEDDDRLIYEKLRSALEDRVEDAASDKDKARAVRALKEFEAKAGRGRSG